MSREARLRMCGYLGAIAGFSVLVFLLIRADLSSIAHAWWLAGWSLLWLLPYRTIYLLLYALGWRALLNIHDVKKHATIAYLWWVSSVREAIDRLLPVAGVGGGLAGVRLLRWRGMGAAAVGATVIIEAILTLMVSYVFAALGMILMLNTGGLGQSPARHVWLAIASTLPVPVTCFLLLRYGALFVRLQHLVGSTVGAGHADHAAQLDHELQCSLRRTPELFKAGTYQLAAMISASFEIWFAMRLFGHPIEPRTAFVLESATQAVRHLAFFIPGGLGVQEAGLILFAGMLGINAPLALAVSFTKRLREILCGLPALLSWQWLEARRLRYSSGNLLSGH